MLKKLSFILAVLMLFNLIVPSAAPIAEILSEEVSNMEFERMRDNQRKTYVRELDPERELQKKSRAGNKQKEKSIDLTELRNKISVDDETIKVLTKIYPDIQEISTILNKIDRFANRNNISEEEKEKLIIGLKEGKTLDEVLSKYIKENKKAETEEMPDNISEKALESKSTLLATNDDVSYSKRYIAPFTIDKNNESINPSNGSLTYKYPIVNLQGINGLDVNLEAVYNSRDAVIWGITSSTTFTEKNNRLGIGWSWNLPVIEIDEEYDYYDPVLYLHLGDGTVYEIWNELYENNSNLHDHPSLDLQLLYDRRNFSNSEMSSRYVLKEKDGKQTYFGRDGRLLGIVDRYGNTITFEHTIIDDHPVVNRIIDTLGRTVRISYWDDEVLVRAPGGKRTDLWLEKIRHDGRTYSKTALETIIDPIGRRTEINYFTEKIWFSETHKTRFDDYDIEVNLYDVTYPTGIRTDFEYELTTENLGRYGAIERNRILSRLDYNRSERKRYNRNDYSYSRNNSTGYPRYDNPWRLPDDFTYYTYVENQDGTEVDYTFNNEHLVIEQTVADSRYLLRETTYSYNTDINHLPTRITKREYTRGSNDYYLTRVRYTYDEYSNIISEIDERGNETRYEYSRNYNLPRRTEKYENRKLKSEVNYYPSRPERMDIGEEVRTNIVDGVDKSITITYNYDSYGNITEKKIMGAEGTTKEKYQYYEDAYVSKVTITDENNSISYVEETDYDFNTGLVASSTDGRGNKTSYEYDILGRLVKTINPDRTQETISYNDEENQTTVTDANNYVTKLSYDPLGNHIKTEQKINGRMIVSEEKGYNLMSQLEWVKDANGNRTRYYYDSLGRIEDITNPDSTTSWISYEDSERLEEYSDEERRRSYSKYDEVGNIVEQGRTNGSRKEINYSSYNYNNNLVSYTDNEGNTTDYKYDQLGNLIEVINSIGEKIRYEYDHLGNVTKMITAEGSITENEYDSSGRLIKEIDPTGKVREITYDLAGNIIKETERSAGQTITTTYKYNLRNQQIEKVDGEGRTTYTYDNVGNLIEISDRNGTVTNSYNPEGTLEEISQPDGKSISYKYDDNGNIIETTDHYGEITKNTYDNRNRLKTVKQQGQTTEYEYLKNGQVKKVKYPTGASIQYSYDGAGNLTSLINTGTDGQIIGQYEYTYDREGNQLTKEEHGKLSNYTYDSLSRVKTVDEEDGLTTYKYDRNGNIKEKEISHSSNGIYRVKNQEGTKIIPNIKSHKVSYVYDSSNKLIRSYEEIENQIQSLMRAQQILSLTINSSAKELEKDEVIELELSGVNIDGSRIEDELLEEATWTTDNPNLELKSSKGKSIKVVYLGDEEEWIIIEANLNEETAQIRLKVKFAETDQPIEEPIEEEPVEEMQEEELPVEDETTEEDGITEEKSEDMTEEPIEEPIIKEEHVYNSHIIQSANIGRLVELEQGVETSDLEDDFLEEIEEEKNIEEIEDVEDEVGLEKSDETDEEKADDDTEEIKEEIEEIEKDIQEEYLQEMTLSEEESYFFGKLNIVTEYDYDGRGNLIQKTITEENGQLEPQTERYTFNTNNQLIKSINNGKITTYTYSPSGLRDTKTTEGNTIGYYYDRGNVIIETENRSLKARNLRGHQLISREEGRIKAYYLFNGHGDVVQLIDESGEIVANYEYDIYGLERQAEEDIVSNPYRYSGEYYDEETGLYYLRARYYDPTTSRMLSTDKHWNPNNMIYGDYPQKANEKGSHATIPNIMAIMQSGNLYVYCVNNPIRYIDPTGELSWPGEIHNQVVDYVARKHILYKEQIIIYKSGSWGRADLISPTGYVWDVKRDKPKQIASGVAQVKKYTENIWKGHPGERLEVGGYISSDSFVYQNDVSTYYVTYRFAGQGVIAYDYHTVTDWNAVGETAMGIVTIAGAAYLIYQTGGLAAPALVPLIN